MPPLRTMRLRMRSVRNISQVTRALEAVSASKVRKAQQAVLATRAYAGKAFQVLQHLGTQPGSAASLHPLRQEPRIRPLLPLRPQGEEAHEAAGVAMGGSQGPSAAYIYEPSQEALLDVIVPRFTSLQVYQAILEAAASEHSARMVAMRNATDSAKELLGTLQLGYNKARQLAVTNDLLDIVGGVEALGKAQEIQATAAAAD